MIANSIRLLESVPETTISKDCAASSTHSLSTSLKTSLKVLSWNVARSNYSETWARDWMAIVEQHTPDLIFMQEVRLSTQKQEIPQLAEMGWQFAPNFINTFDRSYSGVLIAARVNCLHSRALLSQHQEPIVNTPKVSLFAKYSLSKRSTTPNDSASLLAINVHAINFVGLDKFMAQLQAIELIVLQHQGAVIFAGDFNTWNYARWEALSQMAGRLDLMTVAFPCADQKNLKRFLNSPPLDYIFYRGFSQKSSSARVINTPTSSDHNPLLVELCCG